MLDLHRLYRIKRMEKYMLELKRIKKNSLKCGLFFFRCGFASLMCCIFIIHKVNKV